MINKLRLTWQMVLLLSVLVVWVLFLRFYHITDNQFLFYDEGMYLGYNRGLLNLVATNPPHSLSELLAILGLMFKAALTTAKALWFFVLNLRVFILGPEAWYFARLVSAVAGIMTIALTYAWAKRQFNSTRIALLSAAFLSFLPSHVFYSRLGMQESLSTLLFLSAVYLYTANRRIDWKLFLSAIILSGVFFTNYRMIIAPLLLTFIEVFSALASKQRINWPKLGLLSGIFYFIVLVVGSLDGGVNREVTFGWMFHQAQDASGKFDLLNFLSYPYYTFVLEGICVGILFWLNLGDLMKQRWARLLPFGIVLVQMGLFSFAAEKGARYLCVVLPFMAMAVALAAEGLFLNTKPWIRKLALGLVVMAFFSMFYQSFRLAISTTDYATVTKAILLEDPKAIMVSTQPLVEELYVDHQGQVLACPKDLGSLIEQYRQGARFLILDPQAYISWTADGQRFSPTLINFLEIILDSKPQMEFPHLDQPLLRRFVLDHNEKLSNSIAFLNGGDELRGRILVYDLGVALGLLRERMK